MSRSFFEIKEGEGFFIATAIHRGHKLREELMDIINLNDEERLREEDPFTDEWAEIGESTINVNYSRFEVDLNRPREKAVYVNPEDAWGLKVWKNSLPKDHLVKSLEYYDKFYNEVKKLLERKVEKYGAVLVYDFHSYNHMREGSDKPAADPEMNPEINLGTANMNRDKWSPVVDTLIKSLSGFNYFNKKLDVRENIKFKGGYFSQWIYDNYPQESCVVAIEVKKFFMDEWSGKPDYNQINELKKAFRETIHGVKQSFLEVIS